VEFQVVFLVRVKIDPWAVLSLPETCGNPGRCGIKIQAHAGVQSPANQQQVKQGNADHARPPQTEATFLFGIG
jgi:hypothetical protein